MIAEAIKGDTLVRAHRVRRHGLRALEPGATGVPDLQIHCLPWSYPSPNQDLPVRPIVDTRPALTVMPTLIYPKSRGEMRLASADPTAAPHIDPHFLEHARRRRLLLDGIKMVREIMAASALAGVVTGELHPGAEFASNDGDGAPSCPTASTPSTTRSAPAAWAPTSAPWSIPQLRVRGIDGLRVADAVDHAVASPAATPTRRP